MTISSEHPFLPPEQDRDPVRRLRGRLISPVTLWTAADGIDRAGLTVGSTVIADGDPGITAFYVVAGVAVLAVSLITNYQYSPKRGWAPGAATAPSPA